MKELKPTFYIVNEKELYWSFNCTMKELKHY